MGNGRYHGYTPMILMSQCLYFPSFDKDEVDMEEYLEQSVVIIDDDSITIKLTHQELTNEEFSSFQYCISFRGPSYIS